MTGFVPESSIFSNLHFFRLLAMLGCNTGGRGGKFSKVKRSVAKWIGKQKGYSQFFGNTGGILETQENFPFAYLLLFMSSWDMQENWDSDIFWLGDGRNCEEFPPLCVLAPRIETCHFFYGT